MQEHEDQIREIVKATPWLIAALQAVRDVGPPGAYIAAGAVRDTVWTWLTRRVVAESTGDVDVVYWDPSETSSRSDSYARALTRRLSTLHWDVTNQAHVHRWNDEGEVARAPHQSIEEGIASWPETATAVGVRLNDGGITVVAPLGLEDLFGLVVRWNPAHLSVAEYRSRVAAKGWARRWPGLRIVLPD